MTRFSHTLFAGLIILGLAFSGCGKEEKNPNLAGIRIEQLVAKPRPSAADYQKAVSQAEILLDSLEQGASFEELARRYSTHESASRGGELSITQGWMPPEFDEAVLALEDGELSGVIQTEDAVYIAYRVRGEYLQVRSSHILIGPENQEMQPEQKERVIDNLEDEAWEIYRKIESGEETFYDMARQHSVDPGSAENGGDIGWNKRNTLVPEYEEVAFGQELGEMSEPVRSPYGWHIIRTVQKKDLSLRLKVIEIDAEISDTQRSKARTLLEQARREALGGAPLASLPARFEGNPEASLNYVEEYFVRRNMLIPQLAAEINEMEVGDVSGIVESGDSCYFIRLLAED